MIIRNRVNRQWTHGLRSGLTVLVSAVAFGFGPAPAHAQDPPHIIWVSFNPASDTPADDALPAGFIKAPDGEYTELLAASGARVTRYLTSTAPPEIAVLDDADLIIISRSVNSPHYRDDLATAWNNIATPIMMMSGYIVRSSRMGFTTGTSMDDIEETIHLNVVDPSHPIFAEVELDALNTMVNPYAHIVEFNGVVQRGLSVNTAEPGGNGVILATVGTDADPTFGGMIIGEWQKNDVVMHSGGAETDNLAEHRLLFLSGSREIGGNAVSTAGIFDLDPDGETMFFNAVNYMAGSNLVPPPKVSNLSPADGTIFANASDGFSFRASSAEDIPEDGVIVWINGVDLSGSLSISGIPKAREVTYDGLEDNMGYSVEITVTNATGTRVVSVSFDTFSEDGSLIIEAEEFNFAGGGFFDNIVLCNDFGGIIEGCYFDRVSVPGVDAVDALGFSDDGSNLDSLFRYGPAADKTEEVDTLVSTDTQRSKFADAPEGSLGPIRDYVVETLNPDDWQNYTRTIEPGTYVAYLRVSASTDQEVQLGIVTSSPSQPNQTVETLGSFRVTAGGFKTIPLTMNGNLKAFDADGQQTFRLTALDGGGNLRLNYFFLAPFTEPELPSTLSALLSDGAVTITWTGGTLQSSTNVTGPWTDLPNASSPHSVAGTGDEFFRTVSGE